MQIPDPNGKFANLKFRLALPYKDMEMLHDAINVQIYKLPEYETVATRGLFLGQVNIFWKQTYDKMYLGEPKTFNFEADVCDPNEFATCEVQGMIMGQATWVPFGYEGAKTVSHFNL